MKIRFGLFFISYFFFLKVSSQTYSFTASDSVMGRFDGFSVDNFGRIALVKNDVIMSLSSQLDTMFKTSLKAFRPSYIESSKSFRTLLFDKERSVIHFLDNTLTDIHGEIDLINLDIQQPWLVCESFGGNTIWILDAGSMRLIRLNENLQRVQLTENLNAFFEDDSLPTAMMEMHDKLFMLVPNSKILIFDLFGTFITSIQTEAICIDVFSNYLFSFSKGIIEVDPLSIDVNPNQQIFETNKDVVQFKIKQDKIYLLTTEGLFIGKMIEK